jgi:hypothetical protein
MDWARLLNDFDKRLLESLNVSTYYLPTDSNPITVALANGNFVEQHQDVQGFNKSSLSRLASICQMVVFDANDGPDGDGKRKGLRRQWYQWYKVKFAQPFSTQLAALGDKKEMTGFDGTGWAGRLSQTFSSLVDKEGVTYWDLWVDDASRMMHENWQTLFQGCNIVLAVEKDSLFADFKAAAVALGAKTLISGKGKNSKAATEKMLREHFRWSPDWQVFSEETPLIVLHISDHDMDGERIIGPTFGQQARRYTSHVLEARVGIKPESVDDWQDKWYEVKVTNNGYIEWSERQALFISECSICGHRWLQQGNIGNCPECNNETILTIKIGKDVINQPYGFEVEAMPTRNYYRLCVDALLQVLPFDYIIRKLREECTANASNAANEIQNAILEQNESYQALLRQFEHLTEIKEAFEQKVNSRLVELGEPHTKDWENDGDDPEPTDFENYVHQAQDWSGPWRPFRRENRTQKLIDFLKENHGDKIAEFETETLDW